MQTFTLPSAKAGINNPGLKSWVSLHSHHPVTFAFYIMVTWVKCDGKNMQWQIIKRYQYFGVCKDAESVNAGSYAGFNLRLNTRDSHPGLPIFDPDGVKWNP